MSTERNASGPPVTTNGALSVGNESENANAMWARADGDSAARAKFGAAIVPGVRTPIDPTDAAYGALGDGVHDDTSAIQSAIDTATSLGGGQVCLPAGNFLCNGTLSLTDNVWLTSAIGGNTSAWAAAGGPTRAATLCVTSTSTTFINVIGRNCGIVGFIFYYPSQLPPTAHAPIPYPYTITSTVGDLVIDNCTFVNATHAISLQNGGNVLSNLRIGAFDVGILMDQSGVTNNLNNIQIGAGLQDNFLGLSFPQNIDLYTANNLVCVDIRRSDSFNIRNLVTFISRVGISMTDSTVIAPKACYGNMNNIDLEGPQYGIICQSTNSGLGAGGVKITNLNILASPGGPFATSTYAIWMKGGGETSPYLQIVNGFVGGVWSGNIIQYDAGTLIVRQVFNADYPATVVTSPAVPESSVAVTNPYPYSVMVYIKGGTYIDVAINGSAIGAAVPNVLLPANATIAVNYFVAPTWTWVSGV